MAEAHPLPELPEGQDTIEHHLAYTYCMSRRNFRSGIHLRVR